jgi:hypothetical protein
MQVTFSSRVDTYSSTIASVACIFGLLIGKAQAIQQGMHAL